MLTDKLPALEGATVSICVGTHISALGDTRKAFLASEKLDRIRCALRKQVRSTGEQFSTDGKIYYKRHDSREWKVPGALIQMET